MKRALITIAMTLAVAAPPWLTKPRATSKNCMVLPRCRQEAGGPWQGGVAAKYAGQKTQWTSWPSRSSRAALAGAPPMPANAQAHERSRSQEAGRLRDGPEVISASRYFGGSLRRARQKPQTSDPGLAAFCCVVAGKTVQQAEYATNQPQTIGSLRPTSFCSSGPRKPPWCCQTPAHAGEPGFHVVQPVQQRSMGLALLLLQKCAKFGKAAMLRPCRPAPAGPAFPWYGDAFPAIPSLQRQTRRPPARQPAMQ